MTLEEKHFDAIMEHRLADFPDLLEEASKDCAKITLQHCIDVVQDMRWNWIGVNGDAYNDAGYKIKELQQQLSDLNNNP